ncbi:type VI secretion system ImpA family N-terminal domain-containing protein [Vibrio sp. Isolate23]|uniref:type VI secretion system ImpA family N-terminal domain-containing protein n=1 Tax=Vibrio sp. Isolate23 TaxID=2908533 RepID=UPI001EFEA12A|nr:type VI secretion system ImpA family N-terminal domain-containing protein [Vibrio sp. Isolate23]MCG9681120.1 type VI secretion system ImpA family N-terminal domain-containing protein [Vibrio sp. Isolate23]
MYFSDFARRPVDELTPCGVNPNNLEEFEEIKRQINNINKVTGRVSWKKVQQLSKDILKNKSKDLRCGCYYAVASAHNDGLSGFVDGLNSILDLCVVYWSSSFPEVSKTSARMGAFEWLIEHAERRVKQFNIGVEDRPILEAGHRVCLRIEEELRLHYGHKAPSLGVIRRLFSQYIDEIKELEDKKEAQRKAHERKEPTQSAANTSVPGGITVNVKPPMTEKAPPIPTEAEKSRATVWTIALVVGLFIFSLSAYYLHKEQMLNSYKQQIASNNIPTLLQVTESLRLENKDTLNKLKEPLISTIDTIVYDLEKSPEKIGQISSLIQLTDNLSELYSDSSSVQVLSTELQRVKNQLEKDFTDISSRFSRARTAIANLKLDSGDTNTKLAYQYSNSLFPLLGRIEYAEKTNNTEELDRSLILINVYLHKIAQLKATQENQTSNQVVAE